MWVYADHMAERTDDHTIIAIHPTCGDCISEFASNDSLMADLEVRIIALEEAVMSRRARRRLARLIRDASKTYQWAGSFYAARLESTTHEWLNGPRWRNEVRKRGSFVAER
jgi:hypothetical protein